MSATKRNLGFSLILCLTLGLAPFSPEPHIVGKIEWVLGGAKGMQLLDYWDLLLHGTPWVLLLYFVVQLGISSIKHK